MIHTGLYGTSTYPYVPSEAFGDETAEKNIFRQAVQNGTVRPPDRASHFVSTAYTVALTRVQIVSFTSSVPSTHMYT